VNAEPEAPAGARDAVVVGTGVGGIYMLHRLRQLGLDATALDEAPGPGGTWYWNRYPGARFDSESWTYGYSFSKEILAEWSWSEHFAAQPETLRYLEYVVEKLGVREDMQFGWKVASAHFDDATGLWTVASDDGRRETARYLIGAAGALSAATLPNIAGRDSFEGEAFHTYHWPKDREVALAGRRVAVIGTGATAVQLIPAIAPRVGSLTVFQRRPNWCAPLHNAPIGPEEMADRLDDASKVHPCCFENAWKGFEIMMAMLRSVADGGQVALPLTAGTDELAAIKAKLPDRPVLVTLARTKKEYGLGG